MLSKLSSRKYLLVSIAVIILVALVALPVAAKGFEHGIVLEVDGTDYYLAGAPDGPGGATDIITRKIDEGEAG